MEIDRRGLVLVVATLTLPFASRGDVPLFSGGFLDASGAPAWNNRHGAFRPGPQLPLACVVASGPSDIVVGTSECADARCSLQHVEAQHVQYLATDFTYSADVRVLSGAESHLQFRVSDEGRYGVRVTPTAVALYDFHFATRSDCSSTDPLAFTHCPNWACDPQNGPCDPPAFEVIAEFTFAQHGLPDLAEGSTHHVAVTAQGLTLEVSLDYQPPLIHTIAALFPSFGVGRFGLYAIGAPAALSCLRFSNVQATTDPYAASNFALLYSAAGYERGTTRRALVRSLNDLPDTPDIAALSRWAVLPAGKRDPVATGKLRRLDGKTFGMQLWEADLGALDADGTYTLQVDVAAPGRGPIVTLTSAPFEIGTRLFTSRLLAPMTTQNAEARRGADEDFWRNWVIESGAWRTGVDGAFIADRAGAGDGWTLTRVFDIDNTALAPGQLGSPGNGGNFRLVGRLTIVTGCDAQLRFQDAQGFWWAVTLQAGTLGGCALQRGAGRLRLSQEGPNVGGPGVGFVEWAAVPWNVLPDQPYDLEILVQGSTISVFVDKAQGATQGADLVYSQVPARSGRFGIKAFAATARFEDVQAWKDTVQFVAQPHGSVRIPLFTTSWHGPNGELPFPPLSGNTLVPCQWAPRFCRDARGNPVDGTQCRNPISLDEEHDACNPIFAQLHGFHDSSSQVAEATSHGTFLSGLVQAWRSRAAGLGQPERESLRRAIVANALYVATLFGEGGQTGQLAHSEMGRVAVDTNAGAWNTLSAMYGESAFAAHGAFVDRALARAACQHVARSAEWLWPTVDDMKATPEWQAAAAAVLERLSICAAREGFADPSPRYGTKYHDLAVARAGDVLTYFSVAANLRDVNKDTGRVVPWFEGVYEALLGGRPPQLGPGGLPTNVDPRLAATAATLVFHLTARHPCDEVVCPPSPLRFPLPLCPALLTAPRCPANGFFVLPQASGDVSVARHNWVDMQSVPLANRAATLPFVNGYTVQGHVPVSTIDTVLLATMTGVKALEPVATAGLYWLYGLNPGVPATKVVGDGGTGRAWQTASFLHRASVPFARHADAWRIEHYTSKGWLDPWEPTGGSPWREAWRIDPQNRFSVPPLRSYVTTTNGHVIWDGQFDYWNSGEQGWLSGETFILGDGLYVKAALMVEDWLAGSPPLGDNPYDTRHAAFFDTTHVDRLGTGWLFDSPDAVPFAHASRAVHEFCTGKAFSGGRLTGHYLDERSGAVCVPDTGIFFDATGDEVSLAAQGDDFTDIDATPWAQEARVASRFCTLKQFVGGFFTGHQLAGKRGIVCLGADAARLLDVTASDLAGASVDVNGPWAAAARVGTNVCVGKGYPGGYLTGQPMPGPASLVCVGP